MARATDAADILPECLIQKILSYLEYEEVAKMSILSKTWLQALLALPYLKFNVVSHKEINIVDKIMERYSDCKIPIVKFEFSNFSGYYDREVLSLIDKWLGIALRHGVKDLLYRGTSSYPLSISKILAAKSLRELILTRCNLMSVSSCGVVTNCNSLRKISLSNLSLDENMLQTLLTSCPLIVVFILDFCSGLEKIELRNLQKIKSVSIGAQRNQCVKIQAPTLEHLSYSGTCCEDPPMLEIIECQILKSLKLSRMQLSDEFQHLISTYQFLESMMLNSLYIGFKLRLNICGNQSLRVLKICNCERIAEIDAPNLVSLHYMGYQIPKLQIAKGSSQLKHSHVHLDCWSSKLNASWFFKLRKFLSNSISWSQVSLCFRYEIDGKDMQLHHLGFPPQVNVLNVDIKSDRGFPTFADALLWSCHPRKLILASSVEMITCFVDRLMFMKNLSHSTSRGSNPRHNQIMEVKAFDEKNQPLELTSGEMAIRKPMERKKVYFLLDW